MKKWIGLLVILLILLLAGVYVFIPATLKVSCVRYVTCYHGSVQKFITDPKWFNDFLLKSTNTKESDINGKDFSYKLTNTFSNLTEINIHANNIDVMSHLLSFSVYLDSSAIQWSAEIKTGNNPISRITTYYKAVSLKKSMEGLISTLKEQLDKPENLYGIHVKEVQFADTVLITSKFTTVNTPPDTRKLYSIVALLKTYAGKNNAAVVDSPMTFTQRKDSMYFETMVGLPINKLIIETGEFKIKRIPHAGNMLQTEIKGGLHTIDKGFEKLTEYFLDSKRQSPAIPFQMLITNRLAETDTSKWITKIYYPVM
ncbi:MAG: GyrI-like domain-containing protein [Sphingobacteriia bacterium]|nr:GyrI-like domain-containing protein [Sphingobacteriia bacterium]